jgi:hypothetical protein
VSDMAPESGYWRSGSDSLAFYSCPNSDACPGGSETCATGYTGVLCGSCAPGYGTVLKYHCSACPNSNSANIALLFLTTFFIIALILICKFNIIIS